MVTFIWSLSLIHYSYSFRSSTRYEISHRLANTGEFHYQKTYKQKYLSFQEAVRFQNLFDIFSENACSPKKIELLQKLYPKNVLKCIADVKGTVCYFSHTFAKQHFLIRF